MTVPNLVEAATELMDTHTRFSGGVWDDMREALAALPTDQGPIVCVPAKWLEEAAERIVDLSKTISYEMESGEQYGKPYPDDADLAARLRSVTMGEEA